MKTYVPQVPNYTLGHDRNTHTRQTAPAFMERAMGVEPTSPAWEAEVIAVIRRPHSRSIMA